MVSVKGLEPKRTGSQLKTPKGAAPTTLRRLKHRKMQPLQRFVDWNIGRGSPYNSSSLTQATPPVDTFILSKLHATPEGDQVSRQL